MELKNFPYHWFQTEYVIHGAASYIFAVLAAQWILEHQHPRGPWPRFARIVAPTNDKRLPSDEDKMNY